MTFVSDVVGECKESECPPEFIKWAAFTAISAVMRKRVFLDKGGLYNLYPNIYTLIVAKSGRRKSFATNLAMKLVRQTEITRVISGRSSIQAIIKELSEVNPSVNGGPPDPTAQALLTSNEFSNLIHDDPASLTILTELYDTDYCSPFWTNSLKGSGKEKLKEVCLSMIGATTPSHLKNRIPFHDIEGGFLARAVIITTEGIGKINPLTDKATPLDFKKLITQLEALKGIMGEFKWTPAGKAEYDNWYVKFRKGLEQREEVLGEDNTGTSERIHDQILKVAMILSLSEGHSLELTKPHIVEAIETCYKLLSNARTLDAQPGETESGKLNKFIFRRAFEKKGMITKREVVKLCLTFARMSEIEDALNTLTQGNYLVETGTEKSLVYTVPAPVMKALQQKMNN